MLNDAAAAHWDEIGETVLTSCAVPSIKVHVIENHFMTTFSPNIGR